MKNELMRLIIRYRNQTFLYQGKFQCIVFLNASFYVVLFLLNLIYKFTTCVYDGARVRHRRPSPSVGISCSQSFLLKDLWFPGRNFLFPEFSFKRSVVSGPEFPVPKIFFQKICGFGAQRSGRPVGPSQPELHVPGLWAKLGQDILARNGDPGQPTSRTGSVTEGRPDSRISTVCDEAGGGPARAPW